MTALWYDRGGHLEPAPFQDGRRHIQRFECAPPEPVLALDAEMPVASLAKPTWAEEAHLVVKGERTLCVTQTVRYARDARRQVARRHSGPGRRRAQRVAPYFATISRVTLPAVEALLYLPTGESVTERNLDDVDRWIERNGASR